MRIQTFFICLIFSCLFAQTLSGYEVKDFYSQDEDYSITDNLRNPGMIGPVAMGDVNGDGYDDVILGAPRATVKGNADTGIVYIRFGLKFGSGSGYIHEFSYDLTTTASQFSDPTMSMVNLPDGHGRLGGVQINGDVAAGRFGSAVAAGDFDGDGIKDIAICASQNITPVGPGRVYVIKGRTGIGGLVTISDEMANMRCFCITGRIDGDRFGEVLFFTDIDHDGKDDLIIGTPASGNGGVVDIFYGRPFPPFFTQGVDSLPQPHTKIVAEGDGDALGSAFAAGDLTGDGIADLCIGAPCQSGYVPNAGKVYLFTGANRDFPYGKPFPQGTVDLAVATTEVKILSRTGNEQVGSALAIGDFNGDGLNDLVIGAPGWNDSQGTNQGAAYVLYNDGSRFLRTGRESIEISEAETRIVSSMTEERLGSQLGFFNFNQHAGDDLVICAPPATPESRFLAGKAWIILGRRPSNALKQYIYNIDWIDLAIYAMGEEGGDYMGSSIAVGDFNGDGISDVFFTGSGTNSAGHSAWGLFGSGSYYVNRIPDELWNQFE